ncbi:ABC transporter transmembrane domain-containing protein [uncultured Cohaesibacter sp.]|uniref:ABC transporter transmembrane domain-containing protein n=1 Tax=uncultured Cohaesibacter sp. TaxID=1002546 RepID=UPI0029C9396C|nr:ABC transporter transmembrane domain-containing protein [uncultured Cohaesibacter sp.]
MSTTTTTKTYLKQQSQKAKGALNGSIALSYASGLLLIVQMGLLAHVINGVLVNGEGLASFPLPLAALPVVFLARAGLSWLSERVALHAAIDLKAKLRGELLVHLIRKGPVIKRAEESSVGEQATMLTEGLEALEGYFARYLPAMVMMALLPLSILVVTLSMDWLSALVMAVTAPMIPAFMILIGKGTEKLNQKQWRKLARLSAHFLDMIQGLTTLKLFNASRREAETVSRMAEDYRRTTMSVLRVAFLSSLVLEFFATISIAAHRRLHRLSSALWRNGFLLRLLCPAARARFLRAPAQHGWTLPCPHGGNWRRRKHGQADGRGHARSGKADRLPA